MLELRRASSSSTRSVNIPFYCCYLASSTAGERGAQKCSCSYFHCCYLASIVAGERRAQNLQKVAGSSEGVIHVMVVGVGMITMPVQDVIPHIQAVSGNVGGGVPHAMKLVPKHTLCPAHRDQSVRGFTVVEGQLARLTKVQFHITEQSIQSTQARLVVYAGA